MSTKTAVDRFVGSLANTPDWYRCGIEREGLRATASGVIAPTPHPHTLGAKLTHPHITTDFGEAQLELITSTHNTSAAALAELQQLHAWLCSQLGDEVLWPNSMPCRLPNNDEQIAIANYGKSNQAMLKYTYRLGLSLRYGRAMQTVSGVHFNLSLSNALWDQLAGHAGQPNNQRFRNTSYFALMRNYRRYSFATNYLLGASPVIDQSMASLSRTIQLENFDRLPGDCLVGRGATSLRQSDIGYVSPDQRNMNMCFNRLDSYVRGVNKSITTPYPPFARLGVTDTHGTYLQLGDGLLQIENEYYTVIRPKRSICKGQRPLIALEQSGVEYLEIRNLDINPFAPCGVDQATLDFFILLLLWCAAYDSPLFDATECQAMNNNDLISATRGRDPSATVSLMGKQLPIGTAVEQLFEALDGFANQLAGLGQPHYAAALAHIAAHAPLSQQVEDACAAHGYLAFCLARAQSWRDSQPQLSDRLRATCQQQVGQSWQELAELEQAYAASPQPFGAFFADYMHGNLA